jgi:hypothetical protein
MVIVALIPFHRFFISMFQLLQKTLESPSSTMSLKVDPAGSIVHPSVYGCDGEPQPTPTLVHCRPRSELPPLYYLSKWCVLLLS